MLIESSMRRWEYFVPVFRFFLRRINGNRVRKSSLEIFPIYCHCAKKSQHVAKPFEIVSYIVTNKKCGKIIHECNGYKKVRIETVPNFFLFFLPPKGKSIKIWNLFKSKKNAVMLCSVS